MMVDEFTFGREMSVSCSLGGDEGGAGFTEGGYSTVAQEHSSVYTVQFSGFSKYTAGTRDLMSVSEQG